MSLNTSGALPARRISTSPPQHVTHNYESMVAQSGSQQINGPVYGDVYNYGTSEPLNELIRSQILSSLSFQGMHRYHERPLESFPGTYEWILADTPLPTHACESCNSFRLPESCRETIQSNKRAGQSAANFRDWIRHSDEVFWVCGNAGAGKSCLMKFLLDHPRTHELLYEWAGIQVKVCGFFCWAAGGELERSQTGLLRSLLYQLLSHDHEIFQHVLRQRWKATSRSIQYSAPWKEPELREALRRIVEGSCGTAKLCLFIDGLDEFTGDFQDLIDDLDALNRSPAIKICVSSRPWNVFYHRFGARPSLRLKLHELTYGDLSLYVEERLGSASVTSPSEYSNLIRKELRTLILGKAEGVFLWVKLAVNAVQRGIGERDSPSELHARLEATPSDINEFIEKIFDSIEPVYRKYCARVLLLLLADFRQPDATLPLSRLWCLSQDADDRCSAWEILEQKMSLSVLSGLLDKSQMLAIKWCKDLVQVTRGAIYPVHDHDMSLTGEEQPSSTAALAKIVSDKEDFEEPLLKQYEPSFAAMWLWKEYISFNMGLVETCSPLDPTDNHVAFAHRTIFGFARAKADDGTLCRLAGKDLCAGTSEIVALVRLTKVVPMRPLVHIDFLRYLFRRLRRHGETVHGDIQCAHDAKSLAARGLIEISRIIQQDYTVSGGLGSWIQRPLSNHFDLLYREWVCKDPAAADLMLLALSLRKGLTDLFWAILAQKPLLNTKAARNYWIEAALSSNKNCDLWNVHSGTIAQLLDVDINLNALNVYEDWPFQSTWVRVLTHIHLHISACLRHGELPGEDYLSSVPHLLEIFLARGADPGCAIPVNKCSGNIYLNTARTEMPAIESFELGLANVDKYSVNSWHDEECTQVITAILQKLHQALKARTESSGQLSGRTDDATPGPQKLGGKVSRITSELEQDSDDEQQLALIPHKRRRLDLNDVLN